MSDRNAHFHPSKHAERPRYANKTVILVGSHLLFSSLIANSSIIQRNTNSPPMMSIILSDDALATQLPEPRVVV